MARTYQSKSKEEAYKTWALRKLVQLALLAVLFFAAVHLLARWDVAVAREMDLFGRWVLGTYEAEEAPPAGDPAPDEGETA